jgi:hypothetical protein
MPAYDLPPSREASEFGAKFVRWATARRDTPRRALAASADRPTRPALSARSTLTAGFEVAEANDVRACAHVLVACYYRCGEPVLDDPAKTGAFLRLHQDSKTMRCLASCNSTPRTD